MPIEIAAVAVIVVLALLLLATMIRALLASRQHTNDLGYKRRGIFLDRPTRDTLAPSKDWHAQYKDE